MQGEGYSAAGCGIGGSVELQTVGPKSVLSGSGQLLNAPCHLLLVLVSTPLQIIVKRCHSGKWRYINVGTFKL